MSLESFIQAMPKAEWAELEARFNAVFADVRARFA
jgi:hypothetical protein